MKTFFIFLLLLGGIVGCKKSDLCVRSNDLELKDLNEKDMEYDIVSYSDNIIKIPLYLTPNGDGVNELFDLVINDTLSSQKKAPVDQNNFINYKMEINNLCEIVFVSTNPYESWNGEVGDKEKIKFGKYDYHLKLSWVKGETKEYSGTVEVVL